MSNQARPVPVLMYHKISPINRASKVAGHYVHPQLFSRHLRLMKALGYASAPLQSVQSPSPAKRYVLTFDDGYRDFHQEAMPRMAEAGVTGTVFAVSNQLDGTNAWDTALGDVAEPLMSAQEFQDASTAGHEVGSHTADHVHLDQLPLEEARRQLAGSREALSEQVGAEIVSFCYPYGGRNADVARLVKECGYRLACSTRKGLVTPESDPMDLPRINVRSDTSVVVLLFKLLREGRRA